MINCKICNKNTKNKKYCSVICQREASKKEKIERLIINCNFCSNKIRKLPSEIKKNNYCCRECCDKHKKIIMYGINNHRYGKTEAYQTKEKKSALMKKMWKDENYRIKRALGQQKSMITRKYWFGNDPDSIEKRRQTLIKKYGKHPFSDVEYRKKCNEKCILLYGKTSEQLAKEKISQEIIEKRRKTLIETITNISYEEYEQKLSKKEKYYKTVKRITESQDLSSLENYDKRGRAGIHGAYHLDHIIPISYGLFNDIDPYIIGHISNLRFIPAIDNIKKGAKYEQKN